MDEPEIAALVEACRRRGILSALAGSLQLTDVPRLAPLAPDLHADLTTRERVALQTKAEACMSCHNMINPLGFTLEHFDVLGRYRDNEKDKPIDAVGSYVTRSGQEAKFTGARELGHPAGDANQEV